WSWSASPGSVTIRPGCGHCCGTGWAGACSARSVGRPSVTRPRSTAGSRTTGRGSSKRPTTQSLPGLLRRDRAQPDPECPPALGPGRPAGGARAPVQLEKASMAAALCYGVGGGGAQLTFHITAGNYDTDTLLEWLSTLRRS